MSDILRPVRKWNDFDADFYRKEIHIWEISHAFIAWLTKYRKWDANGNPIFTERSLQFTRPREDFTTWSPRRADIITLGGDNGDVVEVLFRIFNNITDPWTEILPIEYLADTIREFLWIDDPERELIVVEIGEYRPRFVEYRELKRQINYPPCKCLGCSSPACIVKRYR